MKNIVEQARAIRRQTTAAAAILPDEQALASLDLFDPWKSFIGRPVAVKLRVRHQNALYECVQPHTPLADWTPDATPALWKRVSIEEWPEWVQPSGAQDAYAKGDKCTHNGKRWTSTADNNVWEPGVYGWTENI